MLISLSLHRAEMLIIVRCLWVEAKRANQLIEIIKTSQHMRNMNLVLLSVFYEHVEIIRSATQPNLSPCHAFHKLKISLRCVHSLCMHAVNAQCFRYWRRKIREGNDSVIHPRNCAFSQQRAPNFQWCSRPPHTHSRPGSRRFSYSSSIHLFIFPCFNFAFLECVVLPLPPPPHITASNMLNGEEILKSHHNALLSGWGA